MATIDVTIKLDEADYVTFHGVDSTAVTPAIINGWVLDAPRKAPSGRIWKMIRLTAVGHADVDILPINGDRSLYALFHDTAVDCTAEFGISKIF